MSNVRTTVIGIGEAFAMSLGAEALFDLTWKQRALVIGLALLRAVFGVLAADARKDAAPVGPPAPAEDPRRVG